MILLLTYPRVLLVLAFIVDILSSGGMSHPRRDDLTTSGPLKGIRWEIGGGREEYIVKEGISFEDIEFNIDIGPDVESAWWTKAGSAGVGSVWGTRYA